MREILQYFRDLGYEDLYRSRIEPQTPAAAEPKATPAPEAPPPAREAEAESGARQDSEAARQTALLSLAEEASRCEKCALSERRQTVVFGSGDVTADLMFVGEGPGAQEDRQGLPFVGPAGELLTRIIEAIDLRREDVYIANIVKCRPPRNRDPLPDEVAACRGYLESQIRLVRPKVLVALGRVAAQALLGRDSALGRMRGEWFDVLGVPTRVTYHPAALLRNTGYKRPTWEDMQIVRDRLLGG